MKKKTLSMAILSIVLISGMFSAMVNVESPDEIAYVNIGAEEAAQLLISSQDVTILDVRTRDEYESGHIAGAESIPLSELEERIDELDRDETIIVYCKSGVRSEDASNVLVNQRFRNAYNMLGGINAWIDAGFPVVSDSTTDHSGQGCPCDSKGSTTSPYLEAMREFGANECPPPPAPFNCKPGEICPFIGDNCHYDYKCSGDKCYERCLTCIEVVIGDITYIRWGPPWYNVVVDDSKCCPDGESCVGGTCQPDAPEFPLGVEAAAAIGLMVAVVYIWLKKRKTKPTVAKRFTTKTPNLDSC